MLANGGGFEGERLLGRKTIELIASNQLLQEQAPIFSWEHMKGYSYGLGVRVLTNPALAGSNSSIGEFVWSGLAGTWVALIRKKTFQLFICNQ